MQVLTWIKDASCGRAMLDAPTPKEITMRTLLASAATLGLSLFLSAPSLAQTIDYGKAEFAASCAGCHGAGGRGDGHFREFLNRAPADLTTLATSNGGLFPAQRIMEAIDGRKTVSGHGRAGEMPIWGAVYAAAGKSDPATAGLPPEAAANMKIALLVDYLKRIQER
jgi:mono/diheme cytochrome c family protein